MVDEIAGWQGLYGAVFIKANLAWSKLRKTSRLGKHAVLEVNSDKRYDTNGKQADS
jgi:hypothetical protein